MNGLPLPAVLLVFETTSSPGLAETFRQYRFGKHGRGGHVMIRVLDSRDTASEWRWVHVSWRKGEGTLCGQLGPSEDVEVIGDEGGSPCMECSVAVIRAAEKRLVGIRPGYPVFFRG